MNQPEDQGLLLRRVWGDLSRKAEAWACEEERDGEWGGACLGKQFGAVLEISALGEVEAAVEAALIREKVERFADFVVVDEEEEIVHDK